MSVKLNTVSCVFTHKIYTAIVETSETQYQRWGNSIVFSCWRLIKEIRKRDVVMHKRQGQSVIGTLLQAISNCTTRDNHEEVLQI